ncbi:SDR family NAD(P)-dependent oxidoreductase [Streptomyces sp. NBC_00237]|uniref:SDR family NAD(P)-dependent oxidoreductase n=1 Tax=Streptomyces sp. NBC_00237 TaxID=2975687 RepID=UPI0022557FBE|nr:SDR family NAD(P)-dependent oxidoreductase [Streptomyces sp. NBC_00237]MCX5207354.1 SDR family NAD(P)-dependent oxidoreductase [Streptomyces sp. NBC_00237]
MGLRRDRAATVRLLAAEGATVVRVARKANSIAALGDRVDGIAADTSEPDAPARVVDAVLERHGRLDGLINNAGRSALAYRVPRGVGRKVGARLRVELPCRRPHDPGRAARAAHQRCGYRYRERRSCRQ